MQTDTIVILLGIFLGFGVLGYLITKKKVSPQDQAMVEWLKSMQETVRGSTAETNRVLATNTQQLNQRLDNAAQVIGELKRNLGELSEVGKGVKHLQEFLQSPKLRGGMGEEILSDTIAQLFPKQSFYLQYAFRSGVKVDAAIKTDAGILPIDAKFPMSNFIKMHEDGLETEREKYRKEFYSDVRKHLTDISKKYLLPEEGTLDFALMYVPSEAVYYEIVTDRDLMNAARKLRIYPVSPNTLYAHLQVLLVSFQGKELEQKSREVLRLLQAIQTDYEKVEEQLGVVNKHVTNAFNGMNTVTGTFQQLGQKLTKTTLLTDGE